MKRKSCLQSKIYVNLAGETRSVQVTLHRGIDKVNHSSGPRTHKKHAKLQWKNPQNNKAVKGEPLLKQRNTVKEQLFEIHK